MVLTFTDHQEEFEDRKLAIARVTQLTKKGDKLMLGKEQLIGISDELVAHCAGLVVEGKTKARARMETLAIVDSGMTLFEHKFNSGEIRPEQLGETERGKLSAKILTIKDRISGTTNP